MALSWCCLASPGATVRASESLRDNRLDVARPAALDRYVAAVRERRRSCVISDGYCCSCCCCCCLLVIDCLWSTPACWVSSFAARGPISWTDAPAAFGWSQLSIVACLRTGLAHSLHTDSETVGYWDAATRSKRTTFDEHLSIKVKSWMAHTYNKRGASTSSAVGGKTNGAESATSKEEDYSPNHVVYKKVAFTPVDYYDDTTIPVVRFNYCYEASTGCV